MTSGDCFQDSPWLFSNHSETYYSTVYVQACTSMCYSIDSWLRYLRYFNDFNATFDPQFLARQPCSMGRLFWHLKARSVAMAFRSAWCNVPAARMRIAPSARGLWIEKHAAMSQADGWKVEERSWKVEVWNIYERTYQNRQNLPNPRVFYYRIWVHCTIICNSSLTQPFQVSAGCIWSTSSWSVGHTWLGERIFCGKFYEKKGWHTLLSWRFRMYKSADRNPKLIGIPRTQVCSQSCGEGTQTRAVLCPSILVPVLVLILWVETRFCDQLWRRQSGSFGVTRENWWMFLQYTEKARINIAKIVTCKNNALSCLPTCGMNTILTT